MPNQRYVFPLYYIFTLLSGFALVSKDNLALLLKLPSPPPIQLGMIGLSISSTFLLIFGRFFQPTHGLIVSMEFVKFSMAGYYCIHDYLTDNDIYFDSYLLTPFILASCIVLYRFLLLCSAVPEDAYGRFAFLWAGICFLWAGIVALFAFVEVPARDIVDWLSRHAHAIRETRQQGFHNTGSLQVPLQAGTLSSSTTPSHTPTSQLATSLSHSTSGQPMTPQAGECHKIPPPPYNV